MQSVRVRVAASRHRLRSPLDWVALPILVYMDPSWLFLFEKVKFCIIWWVDSRFGLICIPLIPRVRWNRQRLSCSSPWYASDADCLWECHTVEPWCPWWMLRHCGSVWDETFPKQIAPGGHGCGKGLIVLTRVWVGAQGRVISQEDRLV